MKILLKILAFASGLSTGIFIVAAGDVLLLQRFVTVQDPFMYSGAAYVFSIWFYVLSLGVMALASFVAGSIATLIGGRQDRIPTLAIVVAGNGITLARYFFIGNFLSMYPSWFWLVEIVVCTTFILVGHWLLRKK